MEKSPFELLVEEALLETAAREWAPSLSGLEGRPPPYSARYLAWEKRLLANPFGYAKRHSRPVWQRVLRTAACIALAASLALGGVVAVNPTARAWVQQIIAEWFGDHARFSFSGNAGQETGVWLTGYLPEGFELVEEANANDIVILTYQNTENTQIKLFYTSGNGSKFTIDSEHHIRKELFIGKNYGYLLHSDVLAEPSFLIWADAPHDTAFKLMSEISPEELIKIAEVIVPQL